ncbi:MAG: hypothetical protein GTN49_01060 [candidate division Zixibacteria bacterium]|nr:hypothetical protein [candidate division Zixibacteria bacterium]
MYKITDNGVLKKIETWKLTIPRYDNEGNRFEDSLLESILEDITLNFGGCALVNCIGYWKGNEKTYSGEPNFEVIIDISPFEEVNAEEYFLTLKKNLRIRLKQEKIYLKRTRAEEEVLNFDEFFEEMGLTTIGGETEAEKRKLAQKCVNKTEQIIERLGYKTRLIRRDEQNKKLIWEREICGLVLKDEFQDTFPEGIKIFAADQIEEISNVIIREPGFAILGQYEFQNYIMSKFNYRPLVKSFIEEKQIDTDFQFFSPNLEPISLNTFVEDIVATIFTNYIILREEGFSEDEISIVIGKDGSTQQVSSKEGFLMFVPAVIPFPEVIKEIVRCLEIALLKYEKNELDRIAILQAKAKNKYILRRAQVRKSLKSMPD